MKQKVYWAVNSGVMLRCVPGDSALDAAINAVVLECYAAGASEEKPWFPEESLGAFFEVAAFCKKSGENVYFATEAVLDAAKEKGFLARTEEASHA